MTIKENSMDENLKQLLESCPSNTTITNDMAKAWLYINSDKYQKIVCAISGGSDSDVMLDISTKCDVDHKIDYVWFDTGLEYQATKDHIKYLEEKYDIKIKSFKAIKPIPITCKTLGQPFLSKRDSDMIYRLQKHNFKWEDKPFDELYKEYPKCKAALRWWCNEWGGRASLTFHVTNG